MDNESNHTETQNANEAQSANEGDESTEESVEIQLDSENLPDQYYKIETILRHQGRPGNRQFLVSWEGYDQKSWVKEKDFLDPDAITDYFRLCKNRARNFKRKRP